MAAGGPPTILSVCPILHWYSGEEHTTTRPLPWLLGVMVMVMAHTTTRPLIWELEVMVMPVPWDLELAGCRFCRPRLSLLSIESFFFLFYCYLCPYLEMRAMATADSPNHAREARYH